MISLETAVVVALIVGAFGGFINSIAKWLESDDRFSSKKNIKAILVGTFTGLALGVAAIGTLTAAMPFQQAVVTLVMIFLSAVGVDQLTSRVSGMISGSDKTAPLLKKVAELEMLKKVEHAVSPGSVSVTDTEKDKT